MEKEIIINPKYELKEYFKVNLYLAFSTLTYKIFSFFIIIIFLLMLVNILLGTMNELLFEPVHLIIIIYPFIAIYLIYLRTKKSLQNPKLKEAVTMKFNNSFFEEIGQTYNIKYDWKEIYSIKETNKWFLIFIQKKQAKVIIKSDLKDNQYNELKELLSLLNIKKSLK
jgi:hypothetical protein